MNDLVGNVVTYDVDFSFPKASKTSAQFRQGTWILDTRHELTVSEKGKPGKCSHDKNVRTFSCIGLRHIGHKFMPFAQPSQQLR